jgi:phosphatidylcholine synthase
VPETTDGPERLDVTFGQNIRPAKLSITSHRQALVQYLYIIARQGMGMELRSSARKSSPRSDKTESVASSAMAAPSLSTPRTVRTKPRREQYSTARVACAWLVHLYTALGLPVNLYAVHTAIYGKRDFALFALYNALAIFIDATDGTFARAADVKKVVPGYDGAGLDNIIDFITFSFTPALAICVFELVPGLELQVVVSSLILIASAYQFCQSTAKTDESFVGFPSYWNILVYYLYYLRARYEVVIVSVLVCAVMSFVPVHFVYPTRTATLRTVTLVGSIVWGIMILAPAIQSGPLSDLSLRLSLVYPIYYIALSLVLDSRRER